MDPAQAQTIHDLGPLMAIPILGLVVLVVAIFWKR